MLSEEREQLKKALESQAILKQEEIEVYADKTGEVDEIFIDAVRLWLNDPSCRGTSTDKEKAVKTVAELGLAKAFALMYADATLSTI